MWSYSDHSVGGDEKIGLTFSDGVSHTHTHTGFSVFSRSVRLKQIFSCKYSMNMSDMCYSWRVFVLDLSETSLLTVDLLWFSHLELI